MVVVGSLGLGGHAGRPCFIEGHGGDENKRRRRRRPGRVELGSPSPGTYTSAGASRERNLGAPDAAGPSGQRTCFLTTRSHVRSCTAWRLAFVPVRAYSTRIVRHHPFSKTWR